MQFKFVLKNCNFNVIKSLPASPSFYSYAVNGKTQDTPRKWQGLLGRFDYVIAKWKQNGDTRYP